MRLLLGSGGITTEARRAVWRSALAEFLGPLRRVLFVPYAIADHDAYLARVREWFGAFGFEVEGIHRASDEAGALDRCDAIFVGGGNSFRLLDEVDRRGLLEPLRDRVRAGLPYVGVSAGSNLACPTIMTTNDMPIVVPRSLAALGLVPFQINPHYFAGPPYVAVDGAYVPYGGETRDDRLREFHEMNETPVLALWEGAVLRVEDARPTLLGEPARLFRRAAPAIDLPPGPLDPALLRPGLRSGAAAV
jgi:dipeptidase E